jgi:hypothetical protein
VLAGSTAVLTAIALQGDGASVLVTPQWSTDNVAVLTIDPAGLLRGVTNGTAKITAIYQGVSDSLVVRVAPNYNGQWSGTYRVTSCAQDASFPISTLCTSASAVASNPMTLSVLQDKLTASGTVSFSFGSAPVTGTIEPDGSLNVSSQVRMSPYTVSVGEWRTSSASVPVAGGGTGDQMTGTFGLTWMSDASTGIAHMAAATDNLAKVTSQTISTIHTP